MSLPIVFVHRGDIRFLRYAVAQANSCGYETIVVGDESVNDQIKNRPMRSKFYHIGDFCSGGADSFAKLYRHLSVNDAAYELFCFQRWYIVHEIAKELDTAFIYADSDILLYRGLTFSYLNKMLSTIGSHEVAGMLNSAWFNLIQDATCIRKFLDFIEEIYQSPTCLAEIAHRNSINGKPHVSDMILLFEFALQYPRLCADAVKWGELIGLDMNVSASNFFKTNHGLKEIEMIDGIPYLYRIDGGKNRFYTLHFQGPAKCLMQTFSSISEDEVENVEDLGSTVKNYEDRAEYSNITNLYRQRMAVQTSRKQVQTKLGLGLWAGCGD